MVAAVNCGIEVDVGSKQAKRIKSVFQEGLVEEDQENGHIECKSEDSTHL